MARRGTASNSWPGAAWVSHGKEETFCLQELPWGRNGKGREQSVRAQFALTPDEAAVAVQTHGTEVHLRATLLRLSSRDGCWEGIPVQARDWRDWTWTGSIATEPTGRRTKGREHCS
jgi:hypothetical protein